ncbi:MAG: cation transporter [Polyangiaceae bacterium]|jgi:Co/Zn/Cd efflux system component|nr:cation transporter [Polyangiaceae bacterium]MBK8937846.1 cation transporter [Polyangiaceae bacterium]
MECCSCDQTAEALAATQGRVLRVVLGLNLGMFVVEALAGHLARSSALLGDSLDMLGDALAYGATLLVLRRGDLWKARATMLKGALMALTSIGVLISAGLRAWSGMTPSAEAIGAFGLLALAVNAACLALLMRHRSDDMNMAAAWTCSRNDLIANGAVLAAGAIVAWSDSLWPDFAVGVGIAILFMRSALVTLRSAATRDHGLAREAA